jgi:hypothetical protein
MQCKYCGKDLEQIPGKKAKEYCNGSHRQMAFKKRKKVEMPVQKVEAPGGELLEELRAQNAALHKYIRDKDVEIDDLSAQLARLRLHLDVEKRFLQDKKEKRSFKAFLKKQPATPLISRIVADPLFLARDTRLHYENRLHYHLKCSEEELQEFVTLWKLMLLESPV